MPNPDIAFTIEHDGKEIQVDFQDDPSNFQTSIQLKDGSKFVIMYVQDSDREEPHYYAIHQNSDDPFAFELTSPNKDLFARAVASMLDAIDK